MAAPDLWCCEHYTITAVPNQIPAPECGCRMQPEECAHGRQ